MCIEEIRMVIEISSAIVWSSLSVHSVLQSGQSLLAGQMSQLLSFVFQSVVLHLLRSLLHRSIPAIPSRWKFNSFSSSTVRIASIGRSVSNLIDRIIMGYDLWIWWIRCLSFVIVNPYLGPHLVSIGKMVRSFPTPTIRSTSYRTIGTHTLRLAEKSFVFHHLDCPCDDCLRCGFTIHGFSRLVYLQHRQCLPEHSVSRLLSTLHESLGRIETVRR